MRVTWLEITPQQQKMEVIADATDSGFEFWSWLPWEHSYVRLPPDRRRLRHARRLAAKTSEKR